MKIKSHIKKIINRKNLPFAVAISAIAAVAGLVYSQPSFYAQANGESVVDRKSEIIISVDFGSFKLVGGQDPKYTPSVKLEKPKGIFLPKESELEKELYRMVGDYPIKEMVPFIAKKDKTVAAFIVGIAKKESNWGKRVPTLNGQDCFNYWGYKGAGKKGLAMGHGCFASPEEAVEVIGKRLETLVGKNLTTPSKMVVWKCGSNCAATGGQAAANKWINDVSFYFDKIVKTDA